MLQIILISYSIYVLLKLYIAIMQIGYIKQEKQNPPVLMTSEQYTTAADYAIANNKMSLLSNFIDYLVFIWWLTIGFGWLSSEFIFESELISSVAFLFSFILVNYIIGLPFELYQKFVVDKNFGFSNITPKIFIVDTVKSALLLIIFGGIVFALLSWVILSFEMWWFWGFVTLFSVVVVANVLAPTFMAFFNKFTPLEDGELKNEITSMMESSGLHSNGIFVMDASKRDSRLNAFFGGLGKSKRVVLFDTLIEKLNTKELLAVLGHELGHFSHGDIWKNIGMVGVLLFISFYIFGNLGDDIFLDMGVVHLTAGVKIAMFMLLLPIISFLFNPIMSYVSRHNEYAADEYGSQMGGKENLVSALLKLVTENKSFPKSHPLVIFFYYTHPPVIERLKELGYNK